MSSRKWEKVKLSNVIEFNPKETIKKGEIRKKIAMEKLECFNKKITGYEETQFTSGTKFRNGDTLLARITPCLENGKTAQVDILDDNEVGFGSTEFIVLREKKNITNRDFIYYLSISPKFRELAIKSMTGTSGRQRVQKDVLEENEINLPNLLEQEAIAKILSDLDKKIEINNQINKKLEEMAQTIFKRWFIDFEFPDENGNPYKSSGGEMVESEMGMIPKGWKTSNFGEYTDKVLGGDWGKEKEQGNYTKKVLCIRGADIPEIRNGRSGNMPERFILEKNYVNKNLSNGDLVIEISGGSPTQSTARITYVNDMMLDKYNLDFVCTNFCRAITLKNKKHMEYFYYYWTYLYNKDVFYQFENGTTGIKNFDVSTFLDKYEIVMPVNNILEKFHEEISLLLNKIQLNGMESSKLESIRNVLLPKLMSGEIRVLIDNQ